MAESEAGIVYEERHRGYARGANGAEDHRFVMTFLFGLDGSEGLYITLVSMLVATFCAVLHLRERYYDRRRAPGPKGFPVIGSSHIIGRYPNVWDAFGDLRRQYGDVFALTLGSKRCLVVSSVEALREVLVAKAADFADRRTRCATTPSSRATGTFVSRCFTTPLAHPCAWVRESVEVQDKIRVEAIRAAGAEGASERVLTLADKPKLSFTESSVYEVIRIVNSPIIPHVCAKDTTVQGFYVPKGTMVMFNTNDINYSAELWEEPWSFRPERFLNEDGTVSKPRHFFPFGTGKRSCMGDGIVRATLVLGLSTLLRHFRITLAEDQKPANFASFRCKVIFDKDPKLLFDPIS
ncbi:cytochrome P450, putative [Ixodes scapularis]|uniref:Cytochrome P450, putative n=1 Tax=Ixodes scapularis TaxID=6945 RepID=B7PT10_IXOSC|nr:cytochrome P450, putative [Ixodes scapularis]|eukprot:XP_002403504.1 cytochrome P450, putative [Ixodes scapularis]